VGLLFILIFTLNSAFGSVHKAIYKPTGKVVAVKKLELDEEQDIVSEIKILKSCNSEFVVEYFGTFKEVDKDKCYWVY
jgi:serine/threonine protein kinase